MDRYMDKQQTRLAMKMSKGNNKKEIFAWNTTGLVKEAHNGLRNLGKDSLNSKVRRAHVSEKDKIQKHTY